MKTEFRYEALTQNGEIIHAVFLGSITEFESLFKDRTLTLLRYQQSIRKLKTGKFSNEDFKTFIEELSYLLSAKIPLDVSIKQLLDGVTKESQRYFLETLLQQIRGGTPLSLSIKEAAEKSHFSTDTLSIQIIASGEEIGDISSALNKLKERLGFLNKLASDIKSAMTYPLFLLSLSILMIFFVFFFIVPKFSSLFSPSEFEKLPTLSRSILTFGQFLSDNISLIITVLAAVIILLVVLIKMYKKHLIALLSHAPIIGRFIVTIELSYIFNSLGIMLGGGIELDRAIKQSTKLASVQGLQALFENALAEIKKGHRLSEALAASPYLPSSAISLIAVGETTARLSDVSILLGERFSEEFQKEVKHILLLLEPTIIIFMGIMISVVVISIMLAVLSVSDIIG